MPFRAIVAWTLVAAAAAWVVVRVLGLERGYPMVPLLAYTPLVAAAAILGVAIAALLRQRAAAVCAAVLAAVLVEIVRETRPDVLSVQELTPPVERELDDAGLGELLPERVLATRPGGFGSGLYSRLPLERRAAVPGRSALAVASARLPGSPEVEIYAVHPVAPLRSANMPGWRAGLRALPPATPRGAVRVLAGDFNATFDHAEFRRVVDDGYEDAAAEMGSGLRATWPSGRRFPPPVTIDRVLADARCGVRSARVIGVPGSDHRAVLAVLELPRG